MRVPPPLLRHARQEFCCRGPICTRALSRCCCNNNNNTHTPVRTVPQLRFRVVKKLLRGVPEARHVGRPRSPRDVHLRGAGQPRRLLRPGAAWQLHAHNSSAVGCGAEVDRDAGRVSQPARGHALQGLLDQAHACLKRCGADGRAARAAQDAAAAAARLDNWRTHGRRGVRGRCRGSRPRLPQCAAIAQMDQGQA